ncbi:hypothetical protein Nepgr_016884 [Nepenthes gracilis]|uniref:Uncharacterized protein n=1 Tax=Nepenthes gracilis TaxID=150966 RepID=A0AAD3XS01_NEPGR|nr:hypothetical protein Nepgr_016884 [Nepenthes gracilis]
MRTEQEDEDEQFKVLYELCSMIIHVVRCPPPLTFPSPALYSPEGSSSSSKHLTASAQISPPAFASLFLGISLALMLFGSLTFVIGIILMPWVIGFVLLFYFAGIVSNLFEFAGSLLGLASSWKDMSAW